jgi:serine/threonine protein kinase
MFSQALLKIQVVEASGLAGKDMGGTSDPYCILAIDGCKAKTKVKKKCLDPVWNEEFEFVINSPSGKIHIEVWDKDTFTPDDFLGQVDLKFAQLTVGQELDQWFPLKRRKHDEFVCGQLHLRILYQHEQKKISKDDFEILHLIGEGSFGKVFQVRKKDTGQIYAMKVLKKKKLIEEGEVEHTKTEKNILMNNHHPFLVNLKFSFQTDLKIYFVIDYVNGGELFFHLKREKRFSEDKVRFYAAEITLALEHLHSLGIIYRDLKPENVLLESSGHIRLTDFGLSKAGLLGAGKDRTATFCGTPEYLAPEVLLGQPYGKEIDWWSLGTIMFEMFTSLPPYYCKNQSQMYHRILHEQPNYPSYIPAPARHVISLLLEKDPKKRLDGRGVRKHPFFRSINWDKLLEKKVKPPIIPIAKDEEDTENVDQEFMQRPAVDSFDDPDPTDKAVISLSEGGEALTRSLDEKLFSEFSYVSEDEIRKKPKKKKEKSPLGATSSKSASNKSNLGSSSSSSSKTDSDNNNTSEKDNNNNNSNNNISNSKTNSESSKVNNSDSTSSSNSNSNSSSDWSGNLSDNLMVSNVVASSLKTFKKK